MESREDDFLPLCPEPVQTFREKRRSRDLSPSPTHSVTNTYPRPSPTLILALSKASWFHPAAHPRVPTGPGDRDTGEDRPPPLILKWSSQLGSHPPHPSKDI